MIRTTNVRPTHDRHGEHGFTLIELLVVIIILGVLSAVVVFAVRGTNDKGRAAAMAIDARTIRTAQEAYCAQKGRYASADELVSEKFLSELPILNQTDAVAASTPAAFGNCQGSGDRMRSSYVVTCNETQAGCGGGGALKMGWRNQTTDGQFTASLFDVAFVDQRRGWAVGGDIEPVKNTQILATTDGGANWVPVAGVPPVGIVFEGVNYPGTLNSIDCLIGTTRCLAVGDGPQILRTEDGVTWSAVDVSDPAVMTGSIGDYPMFRGVSFVTAMNGWAAGANGIVRTTDGGKRWTVADLGTETGDYFSDITFIDENNGWAGGENDDPSEGYILRTTDGGASWTKVVLASPGGAPKSVTFLDSQRGWTVETGGGNRSTVDGGLTWVEGPRLCGDMESVRFVNQRQGWAVSGFNCAISSTNDGGMSYTTQAPLSKVGALLGIDMLDAAHGWAVGHSGRIRVFGPVS